MTVTTAETKEVAKKETSDLPSYLVEFDPLQFNGDGFEDTDSDSFALPFLTILQSNSPQCIRGKATFIDGAQPGMFFNTITEEFYDKSIDVIPVHYYREFIEWLPERGGIVKSHGPDEIILERVVRIDDQKNQILDNGHIIQDHRNHYLLLADDLEQGPMILSLTSTGVKHSKKWLTRMRSLKNPKTGGKVPMYAAKWTIELVLNEDGEKAWYQLGFKSKTCIEFNSWLNKKEWQHALAAREIIKSGEAKADWDSTIDPEQQQQQQHQQSQTHYEDPSNRSDIPF